MWNPREVSKLISQISGIIFGLCGVYLMTTEIKTAGKISLSASFISGDIESGNVGLLLVFLAFFLIVIPLVVKTHTHSPTTKEQNKPKTEKDIRKSHLNRMLIIIGSGSLMALILFFGGQFINVSNETNSGVFLQILCFPIIIIVGVVVIRFVYFFVTGESPED